MPAPLSPKKGVSSLAIIVLSGIISAAGGAPVISEFMASNKTTLADIDGEFNDWIEIHNPDAAAVSLLGYSLTDNASLLTKWIFPAVTLNPDERIVVFASNEDRTDPAGELHTNFKLSANGEYLALVAPDGVTIANEFAPMYPPQFADQSFGFGDAGGGEQVDITPEWIFPFSYAGLWISDKKKATGSALSNSSDDGTGAAFFQRYMWFNLSNGLPEFAPGDVVVSATLKWSGTVDTSNGTAATGISELGVFPVPDAKRGIDTVAANFTGSDIVDYYAANTAVDSDSLVPTQTPVTIWDITSLVQDWVDDPDAPQRGQLMLLNSARPMKMLWDIDSAGKPLLTATLTIGADPNLKPGLVYFDSATPGASNAGGQLSGPIFGDVTENPPQPVSGAQTLTAVIAGSAVPVAAVEAFYRSAFGAETALPMRDDGVAPDTVAGDGVYTATLPAAAFAAGEMTRWRFVASDTDGTQSRSPAFRASLNSPEYFGTVGADPGIETNLTVFHWFTEDPGGAETLAGSSGSVYYLGEFYDNVRFSRHGQTSASFFKKSFNIDFNKSPRFRWRPDEKRVSDINLMSNWADKSKVRHPIAWELMRATGVNAHFAFTVRVEQNGAFYSTAEFIEDADDTYLERVGLNKDGDLYKVFNNQLNKDRLDTGGNPVPDSGDNGLRKKNRKNENNNTVDGLIDGLDLTGTALNNYIRDNIDIPKCINMLATNSLIRNIDLQHKNWYLYRDTGKTDEWAILPWDLDLSGGRKFSGSYFHNTLDSNNFITTGGAIRLVSHLLNHPETRSMLMRRIRTVCDTYLQPEETPLAERWYETRLDELSALIDDQSMAKSDAQRDFEKWGSWLHHNDPGPNSTPAGAPVPYTTDDPAVETMAEAVARWKDEYLPARRDYIYNQQTVGNGGEIPLPQESFVPSESATLVVTGVGAKFIVPANGDDGVDWTGAPAFEPFDDSGWTAGPTGIGYERSSGYEPLIASDVDTAMMSGNSLYIRIPFNVTDPAAFDSLELRMQYDDGFVAFLNGTVVASANAPEVFAWDSFATSGSHEAQVGAFDTFDISDTLASLQAGGNILAIHGLNRSTTSSDFIINPELHASSSTGATSGQPLLEFGAIEFSPASGNQDEEFIEIANPFTIAVDVSGWQITGGIDFTFHPGTVIPAGRSFYISPDVNAFRARAASPKGGEGIYLQGAYSGHLSSFGETLNLLDSAGTLNATTSFTGDPSDAQLNLIVSEIMYSPGGDGLAEFIELTNISTTLTLDLTGVKFTDGITFDFTGSAITSLAPGARVLVVRDTAAFAAAHSAGLPVAGIFADQSRLSNDGETVKLEDALNGTIKEFTYNDVAPWPLAADDGYSLVLIAPASNPDPSVATNWRSSTQPGGNPDSSDAIPFPADPLGDADGNGVADLIDHALGNGLGTGPIAPTAGFQSFDIGGAPQTQMTLSYPISLGAEGATVGIDASANLTDWQDAGSNTELVSQQNLGDGRALVTVRFTAPLGEGPRQFLRLRVEAQ